MDCRSVFASLILLGNVTTLSAHAILLSATPADAQVIQGPDLPIRLQFNVRIDSKRSRLSLLTPDGVLTPLVIAAPNPRDTIASEVTGLRPGSYVLRWQVLADDGHITRGEVRFRVQ